MASSIIHYIVSHLVADKIGVEDLNKFLIGAVLAPDTGNKEDGSYCKLHCTDIREDIALKGINWITFVDEHSEEMNNDYFKGYCCHLIMDALWVHDVYDKYIRYLPKDIKAEKIQAMYRDYWRLNHLLIKQYKIPNEPINVAYSHDADVVTENLLYMAESFKKQLQAPKCNLDDLEILTWDIVSDYVGRAKEICLQEMTAILDGKERMDPLNLYVPIAHIAENSS